MNVGKIEGADYILGAPEDWDQSKGECEGLPVKVMQTPNGAALVSEWIPTADERRMIATGGRIRLWVYGSHPVVALETVPSQIIVLGGV